MYEKTCFNCKWMFITDDKFYCVSEMRRQMSYSEVKGDASMCTGWRIRPYLEKKLLIEFKPLDNDSANRFHDLVRHLIRKNIDGRFIIDATSRIIN